MRPIFIGGCGRSGTTLLGAMLGSHPRYLATPEAKFNIAAYTYCLQQRSAYDIPTALEAIQTHWSYRLLGLDLDLAAWMRQTPNASYGDLIRWIVAHYGCRVGKPDPSVWIDHTPGSILHTRLLLELYPDAKILHLVRDARAVAASVVRMDWGPNTVDRATHWWIHKLAHGFAAELDHGPERILRVHYEDLVRDPAHTLRHICAFLDIDYHDEMVNGSGFHVPVFASQGHTLVGSRPDASRSEAWRSELSPRQIEIIESIAGTLLRYLGYPMIYGDHARRMTQAERVRAFAIDLVRQVTNPLHQRRRRAKAVAASRSAQTMTAAAQS